MRLHGHPKDTGSYCFTPKEAGKARSLDLVDETQERVNHAISGMWVLAGHRGKQRLTRSVAQTMYCTATYSPGTAAL